MLEEILRYLHNYFVSFDDIRFGTWTISDGAISLPFLNESQYFRVNGSDFNDGIYQYPASDLTDEVFYGSIWPLKIPPALLALVKEIEAWQEEYGSSSAALGPFQSESFGGYSYSKASSSGSSSTDSSSAVTWVDAFSSRLAGWRKI